MEWVNDGLFWYCPDERVNGGHFDVVLLVGPWAIKLALLGNGHEVGVAWELKPKLWDSKLTLYMLNFSEGT